MSLPRATSGTTGGDVSQGARRGTNEGVSQRRRGTSEWVVQRKGAHDVMSENGISGRLTHACRGQIVGLAVSNASNMSDPRNWRTAKVPYVVQVT